MKAKTQKKTISISNKKTVHKYENLFVPYKIQWNHDRVNESGDQHQTNENCKTFFNAMKKQLVNIKNDVERLIQKQHDKTDNNKIVCLYESGHQNLKEGKHKIAKQGQKEDYKLEKEKSKNKQNLGIQDRRLKNTLSSKKITINSNKNQMMRPRSIENKNIVCTVEKIEKVEKQGNKQKPQKHKKQDSYQQNSQKQIINQLKTININYHTEIKIQKNIISELEHQNQQLHQQIQHLSSNINEINQLIPTLKQQLESKQLVIVQNKEHFSIQKQQLKKQYGESIQNMRKQHIEYVALCDSKVNQLQAIIDQYQQQIKLLTNQNQHLKNNSEINNDANYRKLVEEFQSKINIYVNENIQLKKALNQQSSQNDSLKVQRIFLKETLHAYENSAYTPTKSVTAAELQNIHQQYTEQLSMKQQQIEQLSMKIMQLQNIIDSLKLSQSQFLDNNISISRISFASSTISSSFNSNEIFNKALKQQLEENQHYKQQIKICKSELQRLSDTLKEIRHCNNQLTVENKSKNHQIEKLQKIIEENRKIRKRADDMEMIEGELEISKKKQESLQMLLECKKEEIRKKDQFIKSLIKQKQTFNHQEHKMNEEEGF